MWLSFEETFWLKTLRVAYLEFHFSNLLQCFQFLPSVHRHALYRLSLIPSACAVALGEHVLPDALQYHRSTPRTKAASFGSTVKNCICHCKKHVPKLHTKARNRYRQPLVRVSSTDLQSFFQEGECVELFNNTIVLSPFIKGGSSLTLEQMNVKNKSRMVCIQEGENDEDITG
ncbi:hypothetical protein GUJ93_ZPchr0006g45363 [Zizania palustris]|uniref:Uncharacterized protein n=1 Tax=Zizania palustris TaxID=103762 RepID=A0A8J5VGU2_ZIZPA|nr:hypothetical protein GUJ93_ZPchr0006g45363 [Zizania palustris]